MKNAFHGMKVKFQIEKFLVFLNVNRKGHLLWDGVMAMCKYLITDRCNLYFYHLI